MQGLYIHIPFCNKLCDFCDFPKRIGQKEEYINSYLDKLICDLNNLNTNLVFNTIYIGGGTPNYLSLEQLEKLFKTIKNKKTTTDLEYSIECNPDLITEEQVQLFSKYGVNRVSIGVQTFNEKIGKTINRFNDYEMVKKTVLLLKKYHIYNINIDMIFGLPFEKMEDVINDLDKYLSLDVPHLSYYSLILEDKTVLNYKLEHGLSKLPDDDLTANMFDYIINKVKDNGYHHYEISNFSKPGYESKHNIIYWQLDNYYGIGMSAASKIDNIRVYNSKLISEYLIDKNVEKQELSIKELKGEFFWLGLRMIDGVSLKKYNDIYNSDAIKDYPVINDLIKKNLLEIDGDYLRLTPLGLEHGNYVFSEFI